MSCIKSNVLHFTLRGICAYNAGKYVHLVQRQIYTIKPPNSVLYRNPSITLIPKTLIHVKSKIMSQTKQPLTYLELQERKETDRTWMYSVIFRSAGVTAFAEKKKLVLRILSFCFSYPTCNAHAPYCYLWLVWLYHIFPHYLIRGQD